MNEIALRIPNMAQLDDTKICYWKLADETWMLYLPNCGAGGLQNHKVEEHEDGTITVTPSILMYGHQKGQKTQRHGFLTRGIWNEC